LATAVIVGIAALAHTLPTTTRNAPVTAVPVSRFLDSLGVCTIIQGVEDSVKAGTALKCVTCLPFLLLAHHSFRFSWALRAHCIGAGLPHVPTREPRSHDEPWSTHRVCMHKVSASTCLQAAAAPWRETKPKCYITHPAPTTHHSVLLIAV